MATADSSLALSVMTTEYQAVALDVDSVSSKEKINMLTFLFVAIFVGIIVMGIRCEKCIKCGYMRQSSDNYCPRCGITFKGAKYGKTR